jgi:hypothetical protein
MEPTDVPGIDEQIAGDPWSCQINLDPSKDWNGSTFTVDVHGADLTVTVDATHKGDPEPYVVLSLPADQVTVGHWHWNLKESPVLGFTFLRQTVLVTER